MRAGAVDRSIARLICFASRLSVLGPPVVLAARMRSAASCRARCRLMYRFDLVCICEIGDIAEPRHAKLWHRGKRRMLGPKARFSSRQA